jgi:hypothetical protein
MAWEGIFMAEVVRSCPEMCRFCLASYLTLPFRSAPLEGSLIPTLEVRAGRPAPRCRIVTSACPPHRAHPSRW